MGKLLPFSQKTKCGKSLLKHTLSLVLILVAINSNGQDVVDCSNLPTAKFQFSQIDSLAYLSIERLTFPQNTKVKDVRYHVVIESESGDYNMEWGPFTGVDVNLFGTEFGPLKSSSENFQFSIQPLDTDFDCSEKLDFSLGLDRSSSKRKKINGDPLEEWEEVFEYIDAYNFETALTEMSKKRTFNAEDAGLLEFAEYEITKAKEERFEVYFNIYPNPAENVVFIDNIDTKEHELTLVIMDLEGNIKMKKDFEVVDYVKVRMNINRLRTGNYVCAVMNKNGRIIGMKRLYKV